MEHEERERVVLTPAQERLAAIVVDAGLTVHKALGPGLLESAYEHCMAFELLDRGIPVRRQVALPINYRGRTLDEGYRLDLLVDDSVIVEVKAVDAVTPLHEAQLLTYLQLSGHRVGFLMNFKVRMFRQGIRRLVR
jgi:GxxExxY protein